MNGQVYENELIIGMTERECRSALPMLANVVESLNGDDDQDGDIGLNAVQAAIAEDAARPAIRVVLAQTLGIAVLARQLDWPLRRVAHAAKATTSMPPGAARYATVTASALARPSMTC